MYSDYWRITACLSHVWYGIFQGAPDDWAEHKASKYLENWYWTPTFKADRIPFFILLYAFISGLITLWMITCTFWPLSWQSAQKPFTCILWPNLFYPFTYSPLWGPLHMIKAPQVLPHLYPQAFIYIWVKCGTIIISCSLAVLGDGLDQLTSVRLKSTILWFESNALNIQPLWPNGYMLWWYRSPVAKKDRPFFPSWIKAVTAISFTCYFAILVVWVGGLTENPLESYAIQWSLS